MGPALRLPSCFFTRLTWLRCSMLNFCCILDMDSTLVSSFILQAPSCATSSGRLVLLAISLIRSLLSVDMNLRMCRGPWARGREPPGSLSKDGEGIGKCWITGFAAVPCGGALAACTFPTKLCDVQLSSSSCFKEKVKACELRQAPKGFSVRKRSFHSCKLSLVAPQRIIPSSAAETVPGPWGSFSESSRHDIRRPEAVRQAIVLWRYRR